MENADNGNECFMPVISSEKDSKMFFSKLSGTELLMAYLKNEGYTVSLDPKISSDPKSNDNNLWKPTIFYYKSKAPKTKKIFIVKNSLLDSGLLNINPNLKSYLKDSRYPKNFSYTFHLFFTNDNNRLSIHIGCECVNVDFILENLINDDTKYYNRIVFEFKKYDLNKKDKQCLIKLVPIKYNNNLSYSTKEENQFKKEGLTPLILKAFESKHINVKHKHREKELEILFFENKQELYNSINKP
ncbi:hypothetical protein [Helicobacter pylori]|uniref:hypothetical protein n=1 Tax=Helicobacter pylori TaxID=210 RepID=UPI000C30F467|nr:hypothetical protein [Helicobacter pylori]